MIATCQDTVFIWPKHPSKQASSRDSCPNHRVTFTSHIINQPQSTYDVIKHLVHIFGAMLLLVLKAEIWELAVETTSHCNLIKKTKNNKALCSFWEKCYLHTVLLLLAARFSNTGSHIGQKVIICKPKVGWIRCLVMPGSNLMPSSHPAFSWIHQLRKLVVTAHRLK